MNIWSAQTQKKFDRVSLTWITRLFMFLSRILPYGFGVRLGGILGRFAYFLLRRERFRTLSHLHRAFPEKDETSIRRIARGCFAHHGKSLFEIMMMSPARLAQVADFSRGRAALVEALAQGRGAVIATAHIGNWELLGGAVASEFPLSAVAAPIEPEPVNALLLFLRERMGVRTILRGRPGAAKELIRVFRENRVLGLLIDQDTDVDGAFVDFLGAPAWTPTAAAQMAIKFGAPVVFGYIVRDRNNRHRVIIEGPLELIRTGDQAKDIVANTALFTKKIEACILRNPEQWVWMHRRWRRQP